jgi:hypothetical protein
MRKRVAKVFPINARVQVFHSRGWYYAFVVGYGAEWHRPMDLCVENPKSKALHNVSAFSKDVRRVI